MVEVRRRRPWLRAGIVVGLLLVAGVAGLYEGRAIYGGSGPSAEARAVLVPRGGDADVARALRDAGVIDDVTAFRAAALATRSQGPLHAGELLFPARASIADVLLILRGARPVQHRVTIPEGLTAAQISRVLDRADALTGDGVVPAEGALLPETYIFERGASRASIASRARTAMTRALAQAWASRTAGLPLSDPGQLLVLASMVERETAKPDERAHVAGVFVNRLRAGMRLQSDPTVIYAVGGGLGPLERGLTHADLSWPNPYNTYTVPGLPAGPIASPGLASLAAVAKPDVTDDLYFVADGSGGHAFAKTLGEHQRNVARWRAVPAAP